MLVPSNVTAHDLAGSIDPKRVGSGRGTRKIDQGERAFVQKEAVVLPGEFEVTHNPAGRVDPNSLGEYRSPGDQSW